MAQTTQAMAQVIQTLRRSSDQVKGTAAQLNQLSEAFRVTSDVAT